VKWQDKPTVKLNIGDKVKVAKKIPIEPKGAAQGNILELRTCLGYELHDAIVKTKSCFQYADAQSTAAQPTATGNLLVRYLASLKMGESDMNGADWTPPHIYRFFEILFHYFNVSEANLIEILNGANVILKDDKGWVYNEIADPERTAYVDVVFLKGSSHHSTDARGTEIVQRRIGNGYIPCIPGISNIGGNPNFDLLMGTEKNKGAKNRSTWFQFEKARGDRHTGNMFNFPHIASTLEYAGRSAADKVSNTIGLGHVGTNVGACGTSVHNDGNKLRIMLKANTVVVHNKSDNRYIIQ